MRQKFLNTMRFAFSGHARLLAVCVCLYSSIGEAHAQNDPERVLVFAAASLSDALAAIAADFEAETGHQIVVSFAGSSALARQILLGAPADLFISADTRWANEVEEAGGVEVGRRRDLLANRLVLVAPEASVEEAAAPVVLTPAFDLEGALGSGRLAIGLVDAVPAGRYGAAALRSLGLWDEVSDRLAQTDNVRAALALVATGATPLGIVYSSDVVAEPRVRTLGEFPAETHPPIVYPLLDLAGRDTPAENAFFAYLTTEAARAVFERFGFSVLESAP